VLATLSARRAGWPFASLVAYALSAAGAPLLLLSALAEHTRNIAADPRASLLVQDQTNGDPLAGGRVTLLGHVEAIAAANYDDLKARYLAAHPQALDYFALADFKLFALIVSEARYVGGFGDMGWLEGERLRDALSPERR
jgi:putative heme iron utilization protein